MRFIFGPAAYLYIRENGRFRHVPVDGDIELVLASRWSGIEFRVAAAEAQHLREPRAFVVAKAPIDPLEPHVLCAIPVEVRLSPVDGGRVDVALVTMRERPGA